MFDIALTLKYNHGNWKWYDWVKLNEYRHPAYFDVYDFYSVRENRNVKVFVTYGRSAGRPA